MSTSIKTLMMKNGKQLRSNQVSSLQIPVLLLTWVNEATKYSSVSQWSTSSHPEVIQVRASLFLPELVHNLINLLQKSRYASKFQRLQKTNMLWCSIDIMLTCLLHHHHHSSVWSLFHQCKGATSSDYETVNTVVDAKSLLFIDIFMPLSIGWACIKIITSHM